MVKSIFYEELLAMQDLEYRDFTINLIPNIPANKIIGVRTPILRNYAKTLYRQRMPEVEKFLSSLPHAYYEEDNLHAFLLEQVKDLDSLFAYTEAFLPHIDNWATCDSFSPKLFKQQPERVLEKIHKWIRSDKEYVVRYAIGLLLAHYLDEDFDPRHLELVASVNPDKYYVHMMIAWYFSFALIKQFDATLPYLEKRVLDPRTHNKAIQKA
ncbi:MAG: DNA alkylation repair protein, partial [Bacillota bacterium]|nr:DNA alkylation repair protein [Bacillota bacterium]